MRTLGLGLGLFPPYGADPVEIIDSPDDIAGLVLWLRADQGLTLAMSPVVPTGMTPPTVTVSGTPVSGATSIEIDITAPGTLGVAVFSWKLNTVVQQTLQVTSASFALGTTGVTASFSAGTYAATNVYTTFVVVSAWADRSGTSKPAVAAGVTQPVYNAADAAYANQPTLQFSLATNAMTSAAWSQAQPLCGIVVGQADQTSAQAFFDFLGVEAALFSSTTQLQAFAGATLAANATLTSPCCLAVQFGVSGNLFKNNSQTAIVSGSTGAGNPTGGLSVGALQGPADPLVGKIAEIIMYNVNPTATQMKALFAYLGSRYGIAVS